MEHNISFVSFKKGRTNEVRKKSNDFEVPLSEEKDLEEVGNFNQNLMIKKMVMILIFSILIVY